jgi:5-methyltetrahydropteroyltriglutamate--homocysteine methyltransferase
VGSLPRPTDGDFDLTRIIAEQTAAGVSVVNDGEWTRDNYIADIITRIHGLRGGEDDSPDKSGKWKSACPCHPMPLADDMKDVPQYAQRFTGGNGLITLNPKRQAVSDLACVAHPRYIAKSVDPSVQPFVEALRKCGVDAGDAFYSVPSPGTLALFCADLFFKDHAAYVKALGEALASEYEQIAASGLQLQVDCPDLAMGRHTRWSELSDEKFLELARTNIDALNTALRNVPFNQIRVHVCFGNYAGPHHKDMPADLIWPLIGELKAKYLLVEGANARHSGDVAAFERAVKNGHFKPNQVIVPGMLDTRTACVENPQMIAASLLRYARAAGHPSRVMGGTDCGFASTAKSTAITADIAWMKLRSLAEGARLATNLIIEQAAPVPCRAPAFEPTPFRAAILCAPEDSKYAYEMAGALHAIRAHSVEVLLQDHFEALRWAVDTPLALVGVGASGKQAAERTLLQIQADKAVSRRPASLITVGSGLGFTLPRTAAGEVAAAIKDAMLGKTDFDKRCLVLSRLSAPPAS